jgi:diguanylate cyclase (GGDEF)-like protein
MSTAGLALVAATAALVVTVAVALVALRARRAADERLTRELLAMGARMDVLSRELAGTVDKVREDAVRARFAESLAQALEPDEVLARCAEAAALLPDVAAAVVRADVDGSLLVAAAGLDADAVGTVTGPPDGRRVRAVGISYHYVAGDDDPAAMRAAIAVPIESDRGHLGYLTVFGRGEDPPVAGAEFATLEAIARHTGPAIERASLASAQRRPNADGLTSLGNRQQFHEMLALEVARALRQGYRLAVCVLDLDDFRRTNERVGQIAADGLLVEIADLIRETVRPTDLACRTGGDEFGVILPHSGRIDAESTFARLQASLRRRPLSPGPALSLSAGIAELKPDDNGVSLFERAERALLRAKEAGKGTAA